MSKDSYDFDNGRECPSAQSVIDALVDTATDRNAFVNAEGLARALYREHPSNQQAVVQLLHNMLKHYWMQGAHGGWDERNEAAMVWCSEIKAHYFPHF